MTTGNGATIVKAASFWLVFEGLLIAGRSAPVPMPRWAIAIAFGSLLSLAMLFVTSLYLRSDELSMSDLGLAPRPRSLPRFGISLLAGVAFFGCFFLPYLGLAPVRVVSVSRPDLLNATVLAFCAMLALGTMEEIVFRGYFLRKLERAVGVRAAIYVTSIAFGLYHGWTVSSITGPAVWGLLYAVLAFWSGGLAVPLGFHVGANLIQALFSQKQKWVSGLWAFDVSNEPALLTIPQVTFGLQAVLLVIGVLLVEYYVRKVHPPATDATDSESPTAR